MEEEVNQSMVRTFIAIELPAEIHSKLDEVIKRLKSTRIAGVRWVIASNIHLTLKFLGDTSPANLSKLTGLLKITAGQFHPMKLTVGSLGAFPNRRQPRVIWVGVKFPPEMQDLYRAVESTTKQIGDPPEQRGFSPHLTLGRIQRNASPLDIESISNSLGIVEVGELGQFQADGFTLFRSDLRPTGSIYTPVEHFSFGS